MKALSQNPDFILLKSLIETERIKPLERRILDPARPFTDLTELADLQGQRKGLKAVFSFVEDAAKQKKEERD